MKKPLTQKEYFALRMLIPAFRRLKKPFELAIANGLIETAAMSELKSFMDDIDDLEAQCREFESGTRIVLGRVDKQSDMYFSAITPNPKFPSDTDPLENEDIYICKPWISYLGIDTKAEHPRLYRLTITPVPDEPIEELPPPSIEEGDFS